MIRTRSAPAVAWRVVTALLLSMSAGFGFTQGANAQIGDGVVIGDGILLGDGVVIGDGVVVGDAIWAMSMYAMVYGDPGPSMRP